MTPAVIKTIVMAQAAVALISLNTMVLQTKAQHDTPKYKAGERYYHPKWKTWGSIVKVNKDSIVVHWDKAPRGWEDEISTK